MSLFCGDKCQCKNRCDADLQWNQEAKKGCREACKGDPTLDPYTWLNSQPQYVQSYYTQTPIQAENIQRQEAQLVEQAEAGGFSLSPGMIILGVALVVGLIFVIKKYRS